MRPCRPYIYTRAHARAWEEADDVVACGRRQFVPGGNGLWYHKRNRRDDMTNEYQRPRPRSLTQKKVDDLAEQAKLEREVELLAERLLVGMMGAPEVGYDRGTPEQRRLGLVQYAFELAISFIEERNRLRAL